MLKQLLIVVAAAIGLSTASASAAQWRVKQIPQGGGKYGTVVVREYAKKPAKAPYALAGDRESKRVKRVVQRWVGPHYIGPVLEYER
jgi:hypothetical protein